MLIATVCIVSIVGALSLLPGLTFAALISKSVGTIIVITLATGGYAGFSSYAKDSWEDDIVLPLYSLTPERIFRNEIPLFNVNFFDSDYDTFYETVEKGAVYDSGSIDHSTNFNSELNGTNYGGVTADIIKSNGTYDSATSTYTYEPTDSAYRFVLKTKSEMHGEDGNHVWEEYDYQLMIYNTDEETREIPSLNGIVAQWYYGIRTVAMVGMMSVLVYIGIRILLASTSSQKAKYKQLLGDWLVGMVILFVMHYGMIFANKFVDKLTDLFSSLKPVNTHNLIELDEEVFGNTIDSAKKAIAEQNIESRIGEYGDDVEIQLVTTDPETGEDLGGVYIYWQTDLMGTLRMKAADAHANDESYMGYTILFLVMVFYTAFFSWTYLKRVITMAFLTLIAPLVALTYPIDKANDGKAQGFDFWFKEYVFNLLLQPVHLLLYTVLVASAIQLATAHMIYAIVAIGFMVPAEKLLRQMFNFSKASTPGVFGGAAGAAAVMSGMKWLFGRGPKGGHKDGRLSGGKDEDEDKGVISDGSKMKMANAFDDDSSTEGASGSTPRMASGDGDGSGSTTPTGGGGNNGLPSGGNDDINPYAGMDGGDYDDLDVKLPEGRTRGNSSGNSATPTRTANTNSNGNNIKPKKHKIISAMGAATRTYGQGMRKKMVRSIENGQPIKKLARLGAGAMGMVGFGTIAAAAGVATGDGEKAIQYAGAGAAGGYKLASGGFDSASNSMQQDGVAEAFERERLGEEEYKKRMAERNQKEAEKREDYIRRVQEKMNLSRKEAKKKLEEMIPFYYNQEVTDIDSMIKMEKYAKGLAGDNDITEQDRKQAYIGYELNRKFDVENKTGDDKKVKEMKKKFQENFGWDEDKAERGYDIATDYIRFQNK